MAGVDPNSPEAVTAYLTQLWQDVLRVSEVRPEDDFFALGGDSMQLVRMLVTVSSELGRELDSDLFFQRPSIATLVRIVTEG
ncbi:acyl carrier protein [Sorangium sp. So ce362]|uniref:acyl carrier protein n=1 Tax=Sorangium sp. So ce362 TaxID=3133303 RepID=UPI003F60B0EB